MSVGFRPTEADAEILNAYKRAGETNSHVLRRGLRALQRQEWEERAARSNGKGSMYCLEAVVAASPVLDALVAGNEHAHVVPLGSGLSLLPMTGELIDSVTVAGAPRNEAFWKLPSGFDRALAVCSTHGPVAYLEAEYFGGAGEQIAQVWDGGRVVLGPLRQEEPFPAGEGPFCRALRWFGVDRGEHFDEFDVVGLGEHRRTDDWVPHLR